MMHTLLAVGIAALYCTAALQVSKRVLSSAQSKGNLLLLPGCALVLHLVLIALIGTSSGQLTFQFANAMSMIAWVVSALVLLLSLREPVASLGLVVFPISALATLASVLLPTAAPVEPLSPGVALHAGISVVTYGILMISAAQACVIAVQNNRLHAGAAGGFIRNLPPLASMESLLFRLIAAGFVLLCLALLTGLSFLDDMFAQHLVHKTVLSLLAWVIFGTLLVGRKLAGWRGKTAVRWTLAGSAILVLAYAGSKFVAEVILGQ